MALHGVLYIAFASPTRMTATFIRKKVGRNNSQGRMITLWTYGWAFTSISFVLFCAVVEVLFNLKLFESVYFIAAFLAISRNVEIIYAFVREPWEKFGVGSMRSGLSGSTRIKLALVSYIRSRDQLRDNLLFRTIILQ